MRPDGDRLRGVITEFQELIRPVLGVVPEPTHVPVHGSLTPLNVRLDCRGRLWLIDWDKVNWGPLFYDELRYWISDLARRGIGSGRRRARQVLRRMGPQVAAESLRQALVWRTKVRGPEILLREQEIRDALFELLDHN